MPAVKWTRDTRDPFVDELNLFFRTRSDPNKKPWLTRLDDWERHVNLEAALRRGKSSEVSTIFAKQPEERLVDLHDARIAVLNEHLNVVESKIGMLFNLNTLVLIALNVMLGTVLNVFVKSPYPTVVELRWLAGIAAAFGLIWVLITVICLLAARRIVWGDLGRMTSAEQPMDLSTASPKDVATAEQRQVRSMIVTLVARTNKFRVAVGLIWLEVTFMVAFLLLGSYIVTRSLLG